MADTYLRITYSVDISDKEMRLICLALAGKLKNTDIDDAKKLNIRLLESQKIRLKEQSTKIEGALQLATNSMENIE